MRSKSERSRQASQARFYSPLRLTAWARNISRRSGMPGLRLSFAPDRAAGPGREEEAGMSALMSMIRIDGEGGSGPVSVPPSLRLLHGIVHSSDAWRHFYMLAGAGSSGAVARLGRVGYQRQTRRRIVSTLKRIRSSRASGDIRSRSNMMEPLNRLVR